MSHHRFNNKFSFNAHNLNKNISFRIYSYCKNSEEISKKYPNLSKEYWSNPGDVSPPNGESWNQAAKRVDKQVDQINKKYKGCNIIAIGHFGVILTQLQRAAKIEARSAISFQIDNLSITHIEHLGETNWRILGVNNKV